VGHPVPWHTSRSPHLQVPTPPAPPRRPCCRRVRPPPRLQRAAPGRARADAQPHRRRPRSPEKSP
jgi:hypothetical protein